VFLMFEAGPPGALEVRLADPTKQGLKEGRRRVMELREAGQLEPSRS
jgi:hypothetical protein